MTITFGGLLNGQSTTVDSDGTFLFSFDVPANTSGTVTAQTVDQQGTTSNVAMDYISTAGTGNGYGGSAGSGSGDGSAGGSSSGSGSSSGGSGNGYGGGYDSGSGSGWSSDSGSGSGSGSGSSSDSGSGDGSSSGSGSGSSSDSGSGSGSDSSGSSGSGSDSGGSGNGYGGGSGSTSSSPTNPTVLIVNQVTINGIAIDFTNFAGGNLNETLSLGGFGVASPTASGTALNMVLSGIEAAVGASATTAFAAETAGITAGTSVQLMSVTAVVSVTVKYEVCTLLPNEDGTSSWQNTDQTLNFSTTLANMNLTNADGGSGGTGVNIGDNTKMRIVMNTLVPQIQNGLNNLPTVIQQQLSAANGGAPVAPGW